MLHNNNVHFNGQNHFRKGLLGEISTRTSKPSQLLPVIFDTLTCNETGQWKICEMQPQINSVTPKIVKNRYRDHLQMIAGAADKPCIQIAHLCEMFRNFETFEDIKGVRSFIFDEIEEFPDQMFEKSVMFFGTHCNKHIISKYKNKIKYYDTLSVNGVWLGVIFKSKVLQRILLSMIAPELNPECWHVFHSNHPPSLEEINQQFPNGYIIKKDGGTRGEGITSTQFQSNDEINNFFKSQKGFYLIESFIKSKKELNGQEYRCQSRFYSFQYHNESGIAHTKILGQQDTYAPCSLTEDVHTDLKNVCHTNTVLDSTKKQTNRFYDEIPTESSDFANKISFILSSIEKVDIWKLFDILLSHESRIYQEYIMNILMFNKNGFSCFRDAYLDIQIHSSKSLDRIKDHLHDINDSDKRDLLNLLQRKVMTMLDGYLIPRWICFYYDDRNKVSTPELIEKMLFIISELSVATQLDLCRFKDDIRNTKTYTDENLDDIIFSNIYTPDTGGDLENKHTQLRNILIMFCDHQLSKSDNLRNSEMRLKL